jgi:predicted transposase/invertase (TIGR01784 family)
MGNKDKAFRRLLGDKRIFLRFLRRFLRQDLPYTIDPDRLSLENLVLENISFLPPDLAEKASDVLYRIRTEEKEIYVYILVEHQSKTDYLMPFRLLSYMLQIWNRCVEEAGENSKRKDFLLPPILPVVFYEGSLRWTGAKNFTEKVERSEDFRGYIPDFSYRLISLREKPPEELLSFGDALGGLLYLSNPAKRENLGDALERIRQLLLSLPSEESELLAKHFLGYWKILTAKEESREEAPFEEYFAFEEAEEMITYLEKEIRKIKKEGREEGLQEGWQEGRQEGWQEGRQEGWQEGRQEGWQERNVSLAVSMLRKGFDMATITELTGLSEERLRELSRKTEN